MLEKNRKQTKKRRSNLTAGFLFFIASTALLFLISCSDEPKESAQLPSKTKKELRKKSSKNDLENQAANPVAPAVEKAYTYNPNGKIDPFIPMISETIGDDIPQETKTKTSKADLPMTPLQKLDVDDFTLVAVIATPTGFCALIEDPAMNGYKVTEGMLIGRKSGVIKKILYNSVIVEENKSIDQNNGEKSINTLTLRKK